MPEPRKQLAVVCDAARDTLADARARAVQGQPLQGLVAAGGLHHPFAARGLEGRGEPGGRVLDSHPPNSSAGQTRRKAMSRTSRG